MRTNSARRQAGMTLAEVLFASAIFAIIMIAAMVAYDRSNRVFRQGIETSDLQQSTRVAFEKLLSEVRMAGFDFDRDGAPSDGEQQPDEQIEYAGVSAITIRGNLDYFTDVEAEHGLEHGDGASTTDYRAPGKFETITTANEEIVTFALKSTGPNAAAVNVQQIRFYADIEIPRAAHDGGTPESEVVIGTTTDGYDLCDNGCNNPPYTLYRIPLNERGEAGTAVPIADNIHSLEFFYYTTTTPDTLAAVTETGASATRISHGAVGGLGQYDPSDVGGTPNYGDREIRGSVRSIKVRLTGMTQNDYYESVRAGQPKYRTYTLETLVIPRNFGYQGAEDPHLGVPAGQQVQSVCSGHCAVTRVTWSPATTGSPVNKYYVCYDEEELGTYASCIDASLNLESDVAGLEPGETYSFKIKAVNEEGQSFSSNWITKTVLNNTQPGLPARFEGADGAAGVELEWTRPTTNTTAFDELTCQGTGGSTDGSTIPSAERILYTVWRSTNANFDPSDGTVDEEKAADGLDNSDAVINFVDNATNKPPGTKGPANCIGYYYRIQTSDSCSAAAAHNEGNDITIATNPGYEPVVTSAAIGPYEISPASLLTPARPDNLAVDLAASNCDSTTNKCTVKLTWNAVETDDGGTNAMAIDTYVIKRWQSLSGVRTELPIDPGQPNGYEVSGALLNGTTFTDDEDSPVPPVNHDSALTPYVYYYTVTAKNCSQPGIESLETRYPACSFNDTTVTPAGALTGSGDPGDEWVMASGDTITVTNSNRTLSEVTFDVKLGGPTGASLPGYPDTLTASDPAFELGWVDRGDGEVYAVIITIKDSQGCIQQPTIVKYVKDQTPAACYPNLDSTTWNTETVHSGQTFTRTMTLNIKNESSLEDMTLLGIDFTFVASTACTDTANFEIDSISFSGTADGTNRAPGSYAVNLPSGAADDVALNSGTNAAYPIAIKFNYRGDRCTDVSATNPVTSMCLRYELASEPGVIKKCNIIGSDTNNPDACN